MNKLEILKRISELETEAVELSAEQAAIVHTLSLVNSDCSSRMDEIHHEVSRRQSLLDARIAKWEHEVHTLEQEVAKLEKAA